MRWKRRSIAAYREPDRNKGKHMMQAVIDSVTTGVPAALVEIRRLGRTLKQRAADVLAFFDRPGTSNGPTESDQRPPRAPPRLHPRLPQPHELCREIAARSRRIQTPSYTPDSEEPRNVHLDIAWTSPPCEMDNSTKDLQLL